VENLVKKKKSPLLVIAFLPFKSKKSVFFFETIQETTSNL